MELNAILSTSMEIHYKSMEFLSSLVDGGWPSIIEKNKNLAIEGRKVICEALGTDPPVPESMVSSMAAVEMPGNGEVGAMSLEGDPFHNLLLDRYGIQVPVFPWKHHGKRYIRISAQLYNDIGEYEFLAEVLKERL